MKICGKILHSVLGDNVSKTLYFTYTHYIPLFCDYMYGENNNSKLELNN